MASWWRYADPRAPKKKAPTHVKSAKSRDSDKVRVVRHGDVFLGTAEDGWIRLKDGSGFLLVEHPDVGTLIMEQKVSSWRYADPEAPAMTRSGVLYSGKSKDSEKVRLVDHGEVMRGWPEDNWLRLEDGSGFSTIVHDKLGPLLVEVEEVAAESSEKSSGDELVEKLMNIFIQFDEDENGRMDVEELTKLMKILDPRFCAYEVEQMAKEADANKDGFLDMKEFLHWVFTSKTVKQVKKLKSSLQLMVINEKFEGGEESFRELWDKARAATESPDDFMDKEQFITFVKSLTDEELDLGYRGVGAFGGGDLGTGDNDWHPVAPRQWILENWDSENWQSPIFDDRAWLCNRKASADKAAEATIRRGFLDADNHAKRGELLDLSAFVSWLQVICSRAVKPEFEKEIILAMEGTAIDECVKLREWNFAREYHPEDEPL